MSDTNRSPSLRGTSAQSAGVPSFLVKPTAEALDATAAKLKGGHLVAIPTETVYGLACDATQETACAAIFTVKGRPLIDPLIVHVRDLAQAKELAGFSDQARLLVATYWPGPLTLVLPKTAMIPEIVTAGRPTVAIRCPAHPVFQQLARRVNRPLAAPSANPFGYISPTRAEHVLASFPDIGLPILDGGPCEVGLESTIVDLTDPSAPAVLRAGQITAEALAKTLGVPVAAAPSTFDDPSKAQKAPGSLERHYSPRTPTHLVTAEALATASAWEAGVYFQRPGTAADGGIRDNIFWLSEYGDPKEAGQGLYHLLRELDQNPRWRSIMIERPPRHPDLAALHDRLKRATAHAS